MTPLTVWLKLLTSLNGVASFKNRGRRLMATYRPAGTHRRMLVLSVLLSMCALSSLFTPPASAAGLRSESLDTSRLDQLAAARSAKNKFYNRSAAVAWAKKNAKAQHPTRAPACTWFVSNALWAGGFPKDKVWTNKGYHSARLLPGTRAAWFAPDLIRHLRSKYSVSTIPLNFKANKVPEARAGDFIAYDWNGDGSTDHLAFIVNIASGQYPEVAEWGVSIGGRTAYDKRGWTWSANDKKWLQQKYPKVKASLIRIN